jgi:Tol biopolymer transport system component
VLPDGQRVLFTVSAVGEERSADRLAMVDLDGGNRLTFDLRVSNLLGVADGWLFYGTAAGAIDAVRFDARAGPRGEPVRLLDGLLWLPQGGVIASLSPAGTLAYVRGTRERELLLLDARGVERGRVPKRAALEYPAWSPDGRRLALAADGSIWEFDVAGGTLARVTSRADALRPVWWPDGRRLAYIDDRTSEVWTVDPDGTAPEALLYRPVGEGRAREVTFTPDGRSIVIRYDSGTSARARDIYIVPLGGGSAVPLVASSAIEAQPVVSPDGRWLAYVSDETGRYDVYVRAMAGGRRLLVSTGGAEPRWEDSTTLVYRSRGGQPAFWRAHLRIASGAVEVATRERLFDDTFDISVNGAANYDVSPTGVFAVIRQTGESPELIAVTNWLAQSRAALAGKR